MNGQTFKCMLVLGGVPQGSIFGPLFFLIYIDDLTKDTLSTSKLFADDTLIFSVVKNTKQSAGRFNKDLLKILYWTYQWKMSFNSDISKQAQEISSDKVTNLLILQSSTTLL